ncbi:dsRBD fold-containing protein [Mycobacterium antarcticum]|uniref:dsRBD fold-containing protein n=1 Tax=Mycolicibacterium sp. TUM20984 TaxID=3023368 RepID=UPI0024E12CAA|nr:dsRBD fold-containing protein [Mycolicibacterium sp. TUM20984]
MATIVLDEYSLHSRAMVRLRWQDASLVGRGLSRLDASDEAEHPIGQKLALARALSHLAGQLFTEAACDIEGASAARSA